VSVKVKGAQAAKVGLKVVKKLHPDGDSSKLLLVRGRNGFIKFKKSVW